MTAMRLRKSLILLPIASVLVVLSHIGWIRDDLGILLTVDERPIDVIGNIENQLNQLNRNCDSVERLTVSNKKYQLAQSLIDGYSPPDSSNSKIASVWAMDDWILVEVEFKDLLPAVVLIEKADADAFIVPDAVWSGYTNPHLPAPFIRKFLMHKLASPPLALINCFEPHSNAFR
ncbi:MAG: hypothetical protein EB066_01560 [Betaproteobacteria bacterium]|nr:hypothetical protein [Betaproteobacteria bacterium]NDF05114.1 hypothetical protein [Betaproteobacteria bacterium]